MDVTILGTADPARRLARLCVTETVDGLAGEPSDRPVVTLYGAEATAVMDAVDAIEDALRARSQSDPATRAERIDGTTDLDTAVGAADLIVDARGGSLEVTRDRLAAVETHAADAILAVMLDGQRATAVAVALEQPGRIVGLSPVAVGEEPGAIEIVRADQTEDATVATVRGFVDRLGWQPVVRHDAPGGVSRRLQLALEVEAMRVVGADVAEPAAVDAVMEWGFDHAVGPLASADRAGLDRRLDALETLAEQLGERFEPPAVLEAKVEAGQLGARTGEGFRRWEDGRPVDEAGSDG